MAVMNGTLISVTISGTAISLQTECSISLNGELRDITNKTSGGWKQSLMGLRSGSINFSVLHDESDTGTNLQELWTAWTNSTALSAVKFTTGSTGDYEFEAAGWVTSLEMNAGTEDNVTVSGTIELDGEITYDAAP